MNFDEILNCLLETKNTIQRLNMELDDTRDTYAGTQHMFELLQNQLRDTQNSNMSIQKKLDDTNSTVVKLNRQATAQRVIGAALCFDMQDIQYKFGGEWENDKAFDCSAFMQVCFRVGTQDKVKLPRTSHEQSLVGKDIPLDQIEPGDTLHYDFDGDGKITHVGLAMGDGLMIHTNNPTLDINIIRIAAYNNGKGLVRVRRHIVI